MRLAGPFPVPLPAIPLRHLRRRTKALQGLRGRPRGPGGSGADRAIRHRNTLLLLAVSAYLILFYGLTNYFPLRAPRTLPGFAFESRLEPIPWTGWIYLSYFGLLIFSGLRLRNSGYAARSAGAIAFVITLSGAFFLLYPTTIVRSPLAGDGLSASVLRWIRRVDPPNNCFPSLHVAMSFICALLLLRTSHRAGVPVLLWAILVSISTVTTKQHTLLDALGGIAVAVLGFSIFFWRPTAPARRTAG